MKVAAIRAPGGLDKLVIEERAQPVAGPGELLVRVRASSLNFHDFAVVAGMIPSADGRIPMSDGAGEVVAVGEGVAGFAPGDKVLSTFFPNWQTGGPVLERLLGVPGDHADGFAADGNVGVVVGGVQQRLLSNGPVEVCQGNDSGWQMSILLRCEHLFSTIDEEAY